MQKSSPKQVLLVFDKFKDTLSAKKVCTAVKQALIKTFDSLNVRDMPISDGGDGFVDCMHQILIGREGIERKELAIEDPLRRVTKCEYLIDREARTAYVEVANSAGLPMLAKGERDPRMASSIVRNRKGIKVYRERDK